MTAIAATPRPAALLIETNDLAVEDVAFGQSLQEPIEPSESIFILGEHPPADRVRNSAEAIVLQLKEPCRVIERLPSHNRNDRVHARLGSAGAAREPTKRSLSRGMTEARLAELISGLLPAIMTQPNATQRHPRGRGAGVLSSRMRRLPQGIMALIGALALAGADIHEAVAQGVTPTGTEMLPACRAFLEGPGSFEHSTQEQTLRAGFCAGYVLGVMAEETEACVPPVSAREAVRTVVDYLDAHSEQLNEAFDDLVERALTATWPCKS
jgi:hypothetical protein